MGRKPGCLKEIVRFETWSWESTHCVLGMVKSKLFSVANRLSMFWPRLPSSASSVSIYHLEILSLFPELGMPFLSFPSPPWATSSPISEQMNTHVFFMTQLQSPPLLLPTAPTPAPCTRGWGLVLTLCAPLGPDGPHHSVMELTVHCLSLSLELVHHCFPRFIIARYIQ